MRLVIFRIVAGVLLVFCMPNLAGAQEAKIQEEMARSQETAARNQEVAARLAQEGMATNPSALARIQEAALRAQAAANRAQDAANRAQEAANHEAPSGGAQSAATRAQESANRAQEAANRAQETVNAAQRTISATPRARAADVTPDTEPTSNVTTPPPTSAAPLEDSVPAASSSVSSEPVATANAGSDTSGARDFNEFLNWRFDETVRSRLGPKNNTNQSETPSISSNTTSLVDKSSVSDLLGIALNSAGLTTGSSDSKPTGASITIPAYAFLAFASGRDPLDPSFYNPNRMWRKISFTYGYDYTKGLEGDPREKGSIYGFKFLPYDKRDPSDSINQKDIETISELMRNAGPSEASAVAKVKRELYTTLSDRGKLPQAVATITDERARFIAFRRQLNRPAIIQELATALGGEEALIKLVDAIIAKNIDPDVKFAKAEQEAFDRIRRRPQVAFLFQTKQRQEMRPDEYMGGLTMDLGVMQRWNLTFNGIFNYTDHKLTGDSRGATFATELQVPLNFINQLGDRVPWTFNFAASGKWMTNDRPTYQGQAKLTIPVPRMPGLEMPISVSFASRTDLLTGKESKVKGRIGFTFDLARLLTAFKNQIPQLGK